jgi:GNAT superfamily N-acetyltransferase
VTIRRLTLDDLPALLDLEDDRGWGREEHKYRLLFAVGEVYGIDDPAGGLAGSVTATRYGDRVTAISMMIVATRHGRRGLGTALMEHALAHAGAPTVTLTATEYGIGLYEKLGFRTVGEMTSFTGAFRGEPSHRSRPARDLEAIARLDADVFGAPRTALIERLPGFGALRSLDGGFGGAWPNVTSTVLGPVTAANDADATALLDDLAAAAGGPVRLDADHARPQLLEWAREHGLARGDQTAIMVLGDPLPGDRDRLYTPVMQALG